jgi:hypothetical protein
MKTSSQKARIMAYIGAEPIRKNGSDKVNKYMSTFRL